MALLLDTHILLWAMDTPRRLSADVQEMLANRAAKRFISASVGCVPRTIRPRAEYGMSMVRKTHRTLAQQTWNY